MLPCICSVILSQMTSKCCKNKKVAHKAQPSVSLMFLQHFDVLCDLLLNRFTATWNLFVFYNTLINLGAILLVTLCHVVKTYSTVTPTCVYICPPIVFVEKKHSRHKSFKFSVLLFYMRGNQTRTSIIRTSIIQTI